MDVREWLETDGLGGFASGTVSGVRTRRYHALLLSALEPPSGRAVLVNGIEAWIETPDGRFALSSQEYPDGIVHPDGWTRIAGFEREPWPSWRYRAGDVDITQDIVMETGAPRTLLRWTAPRGTRGTLCVRPLLSGRDYHSLHHENGSFRFDAIVDGEAVTWRPYDGLPAVIARSNGAYEAAPEWYRNFDYAAERERGLDSREDLASPGVFRFDLAAGEAVLVFTRDRFAAPAGPVTAYAADLMKREAERRAAFPTPLHRAADQYLAARGSGKTILAGFPWFTDWGRDTFIALRGLCLTTSRFDTARDILLEWSSVVSRGMLPNRFPDGGGEPEYNAVDASLWYVIAVGELLAEPRAKLSRKERASLEAAAEAILTGYADGTRYNIRADADGLLAAGEAGWQLTWMDARVGDREITPRIGKPVEIQALWLNALHAFRNASPRWMMLFDTGLAAFREKFWNEAAGCLADVVDVDHVPGAVDRSFRPNQILAIGGLPVPLLEGDAARRVVDAVEARLLTPLGLRSLAPEDPAYRGRYEGDGGARDAVYHQGTVWPWLAGPFVEAWLRVRGGTDAARAEARDRFLAPLLRHLDEAGLGHASEIADGNDPHTPRGCPFQAWSVGELLRIRAMLGGAA